MGDDKLLVRLSPPVCVAWDPSSRMDQVVVEPNSKDQTKESRLLSLVARGGGEMEQPGNSIREIIVS